MARLLIGVATVLVLFAGILLFEHSGARARTDRQGAEQAASDGRVGVKAGELATAEPGQPPSSKVAPGESKQPRPGPTIVGRVVDGDGAPVGGARVSIAEYIDPFRPGETVASLCRAVGRRRPR